MEELSGFEAIQPTLPKPPYARRKIIRGADGTPQVVLVDQQGNQINDMSAYGIVDSGNYYNPGPQAPTGADNNSNAPVRTGGIASTVIDQTIRQSGGDAAGDSNTPGSGSFGRTEANNFGYVNKPTGMGFASALPGPFGLAGRAVNTGINANNAAAVNSARTSLGLPGIGVGGAIKSTLKDNKGQVADVSIGGSNYATPVGFEALSPEGMTNMTPAEAAARARATGSISLSTPEAVAARDQAFEAEFSKPGLFERVGNVATSFLDSVFGNDAPSYQQYDPVAHAKTVSQNTGDNFKPTNDGFSNMLGGGSSDKSGSSPGSGGLGRNSDGSSNGWGGRSGSV